MRQFKIYKLKVLLKIRLEKELDVLRELEVKELLKIKEKRILDLMILVEIKFLKVGGLKSGIVKHNESNIRNYIKDIKVFSNIG